MARSCVGTPDPDPDYGFSGGSSAPFGSPLGAGGLFGSPFAFGPPARPGGAACLVDRNVVRFFPDGTTGTRPATPDIRDSGAGPAGAGSTN